MPKLSQLTLHAMRQYACVSAKSLREQHTQPDIGLFGKKYPCCYCKSVFLSEAGRAQHITSSPSCNALLSLAEQRTKFQLLLETAMAAQDRDLDNIFPEYDRRHLPSHPDLPEPGAGTQAQPIPPTSISPTHTNPHAPNQPGDQSARTSPPKLHLKDGVYVEDFPNKSAGAPISNERAHRVDSQSYLESCGVLADLENFEAAELLMTTGLTNGERTRHLRSRKYRGTTPWKNCNMMLRDVDQLRHGPEWRIYEVPVHDGKKVRKQYMFARNPVDVVRELIGSLHLEGSIHYAPKRYWASDKRDIQVFDEMWSGKWWWRIQLLLRDKNGTIVPVIIASDKTKLSILSGGQQAYPVYLTIGNISKAVRRKPSYRATILLGYLPIDDFADIPKKHRQRLKGELLHRSMQILMAPLKEAGESGVEMWCADGRLRRVYPILAAFVGDWPEQNDMSCTGWGGCPICLTKHQDRANFNRRAPNRNRPNTLEALRAYQRTRDLNELKELQLKPWWPWWADLPFADFPSCIAPDILHQLHQGILKHLLSWSQKRFKKKKLDIDRYFASMTKAEGMRHFTNGITRVEQWTGRESKEIEKQLLPVLIGTGNEGFAALVRAALDFIYRAQAARMSDEDIKELEEALAQFHSVKDVLIDLKIFANAKRFNKIPKLHMLSHYSHSIRELGTPDGYSTESPERLHIEYAKKPWRASNKVRPLPQMVLWVQRLEAISIHRAYLNNIYQFASGEDIEAILNGDDEEEEEEEEVGSEDNGGNGGGGVLGHEVEEPGEDADEDVLPQAERGTLMDLDGQVAYPHPLRVTASKAIHATHRVGDAIDRYGASLLISRMSKCLEDKFGVPARDTLISRHHTISIWHRFYIYHAPLPFAPKEPLRRDVVRATPPLPSDPRTGRSRRAGTFDTVLYLDQPGKHGLQRYRAGRVRLIFKLPGHLHYIYKDHLVYLELFTPFTRFVSPFHGLCATSHDQQCGVRNAIVVPLSDITMACHLAPQFQHVDEALLLDSTSDVLADSRRFFFNHYYNRYIFMLVEHWRRTQGVT